jgi:multidrug efflux system membrane fusion protein
LLSHCLLVAQSISPEAEAPLPPAVPVSKLIQREITEFVMFTGRTEAIQLVDIRPRVTGYLTKMLFREGSEVKQGDLLFEVDPRPYQAQYDQAVGQVKLYEAQLKLAKTTLDRGLTVAKTPGAIAKQQIDQDQAAVEEAEARLKAFNASLVIYKLNLDFTQVTSPINGQVSRFYLTVGNLVNQDQTLLTTVVSLDPMYAYFDVDEPTVLRVRKAVNEGKIKRYQEGKIPVYMGLQGEEGFPHQGTLNFVNNQVNPATGSILVRGVFPNPIPASGTTRVLSPGMFVRIRLPIGQPHPALLVIDRAIGSDQGLKYVYVVNKDNKVEYRRVTTGALQDDGMRVILSGLKADESVVVGGLQLVRPNMEIQPDRMPMPALDQAPDDIDKKGKVQPDPADPKPQDGETKSEKQGEKAEPKEKAQPSGEKAEAK